jgi:hypothetical protein
VTTSGVPPPGPKDPSGGPWNELWSSGVEVPAEGEPELLCPGALAAAITENTMVSTAAPTAPAMVSARRRRRPLSRAAEGDVQSSIVTTLPGEAENLVRMGILTADTSG